ncbi:PspC domain-containing protein [Acidiferrimicrobium sp. IK]|nr:PspC domain-containing protein [Acidiferrimicrobium sp. IK]
MLISTPRWPPPAPPGRPSDTSTPAVPTWAGPGGGRRDRHWHDGRGRRWAGPAARWRRGRSDGGPLRRRPEQALLGGLASGVAAKTGFDVTSVRVAFALASLASGIGVAAYAVAWLVIPAEGQAQPIGRSALMDKRGLALTGGLLPVLGVLLLLASALGAGWLGAPAWPAAVTSGCLVMIWRNGTGADRDALRRVVQPIAAAANVGAGSRRSLLWRTAAGVVAAVAGVAILASGRHRPIAVPLVGVALVLAALVVLLGPWWLRVARELMVERQARIRAEERAEIAARVHDSVLQTLALIQRSAADPARVAQLARAQERELRAWLFEGRSPGDVRARSATVAGAVAVIQAEVEREHGVVVDTVVVGDAPLTSGLEALMAAAREATVNAARWSGAPSVSLFAEVEPQRVSAFVRDRGCGFDRRAVGADRRGISESIEGRMARCGGRASIRSAPGEGTEVELTVATASRVGDAP